MAQCTAKSKHSGERCKKHAIMGRTVCRVHGGKSLLGIASPTFKTGKYSKNLPTRIAARYVEALNNKELLSLRDDIAAAEARLADLFARVDSGESGHLWQSLGVALDAFNKALATNDLKAMQGHLTTMRALISRGSNDFFAWQEIQSLWETRAKLALTEIKTLTAARQFITLEQLLVHMAAITDAINRIVPAHADASTSRAILGDLAAEFARLGAREAAEA